MDIAYFMTMERYRKNIKHCTQLAPLDEHWEIWKKIIVLLASLTKVTWIRDKSLKFTWEKINK